MRARPATKYPQEVAQTEPQEIRSLLNLGKEDDAMKYIVKREGTSAKKKDTKPYTKPPRHPSEYPGRPHIPSLKRRCIEHQKEQKAEFEALLSKVTIIKAVHKTTV
ncbi:hypothetical protein H0H87_010098 [Tephrocybe sp. NHM501043]|nr:hypothetical protein H0H87_010098 [Tephrocybe sp. NHM501043]